MARPGPQTQAKRRREQDKKDKRKAKEEKKAQKKALKEEGDDGSQEIAVGVDIETGQPVMAELPENNIGTDKLAANSGK